jgi:hypothetical protein
VSEDVRVPTIVDVTADNEWQRVHLYNQERMISQGDAIEESLKGLLETQQHMAEFAAKLHENMNVLDETLKQSSKAMSGFVTQIVKVPIVIVLFGIASWAFYIGRLSERGWILILAVAAFPYLGDGIVAIFKIVRGQNGSGTKT